MPFEVVLPRLGWNMETGQLGEWLKNDGDHKGNGNQQKENQVHRFNKPLVNGYHRVGRQQFVQASLV